MKTNEKIEALRNFVNTASDAVRNASQNEEELKRLQNNFHEERARLNASIISIIIGTEKFDRKICIFRNLPSEEEVMEIASIADRYNREVVYELIDDRAPIENTDNLGFIEFVKHCLSNPDFGVIDIMKLYKRITNRRTWQRRIGIGLGVTLGIITGLVFWKYKTREEDFNDDDIVILMDDDEVTPTEEDVPIPTEE